MLVLKCSSVLASQISRNSRIYIGPEVKKKTEEVVVECEDDPIVPPQPENSAKAVDVRVREKPRGTMLLTSFF